MVRSRSWFPLRTRPPPSTAASARSRAATEPPTRSSSSTTRRSSPRRCPQRRRRPGRQATCSCSSTPTSRCTPTRSPDPGRLRRRPRHDRGVRLVRRLARARDDRVQPSATCCTTTSTRPAPAGRPVLDRPRRGAATAFQDVGGFDASATRTRRSRTSTSGGAWSTPASRSCSTRPSRART